VEIGTILRGRKTQLMRKKVGRAELDFFENAERNQGIERWD